MPDCKSHISVGSCASREIAIGIKGNAIILLFPSNIYSSFEAEFSSSRTTICLLLIWETKKYITSHADLILLSLCDTSSLCKEHKSAQISRHDALLLIYGV